MRLLLYILLLTTVVAWGKPPDLKHLFPAGGQRGTEMEAVVGGTFDPWPVDFWCDHPGIRLAANKTNQMVSISVSEDVPSGCYLIAARNAEGFSAPRWFEVSAFREVAEEEPNSTFANAQSLTNLPMVLNGTLEKNDDVDHFRIELKEGDVLNARISAYGIDSPVDAMLHLFDEEQRRIAFNHDAWHLDPWLLYTARHDQVVILQTSGFAHPPKADVRFAGSKETVYRLSLELRSAARVRPFPVLLGTEGWPRSVRGGLAEKSVRYPFEAKKGEMFTFTVHAAKLGYAVDPVLWVEEVGSSKELTRGDDMRDKRLDPELSWTAKADGSYALGIADLYHRWGPERKYQLDMVKGSSTFDASCEAFSVTLEAGGTTTLQVNARRLFGEKAVVALVTEGLPPGVWASAPMFPDKTGDITLTLNADEDLLPIQQPFKLFAIALEEQSPRRVPVVFRLKGLATPHLDLEKNKRQSVWLTVTPKG